MLQFLLQETHQLFFNYIVHTCKYVFFFLIILLLSIKCDRFILWFVFLWDVIILLISSPLYSCLLGQFNSIVYLSRHNQSNKTWYSVWVMLYSLEVVCLQIWFLVADWWSMIYSVDFFNCLEKKKRKMCLSKMIRIIKINC